MPTATPAQDTFFTGLDNTKPYFKCALEGFAGCGKTYTAAMLAIGLHKRIGSKLPIVIFDTEEAAKFLKPFFAEAGIQVLLRSSRSMADLKETMERMRNHPISNILIIDSISHVWEEFLKAYMEKKNRTRLEFQDWGQIKPTWKTEFSNHFVRDPYHVIMTGRAGYEYETEKNAETGKREIFKSGVKMKVEGETAYEPDVLVLMERFEDVLEAGKIETYRSAKIIKDRSTLIDGKIFKNPKYEDFAPAIDRMLESPVVRDLNMIQEGDTALLFKNEEDNYTWRRERDKAVEDLNGLLDRIAPGSGKAEKQLKSDLLMFAFGTASDTAIAEMKPDVIRTGYKKIGDEAIKRGIAVVITVDNKPRLVSKDFLMQDDLGEGVLPLTNEAGEVTDAVEKKPKKEKKEAI